MNYTNVGIADIHRYSMLGNGWTVDVIAHIFKGIQNISE
jgi:DNA (cytosine-5)-methyltransferase 3A